MDIPNNPEYKERPLMAEVEKIAAEIQETKSAAPIGREQVKSALTSYLSDDSANAPPPSAEAESAVLPEYVLREPAEVRYQVEKLIDIAWHKNVQTAVKLAKKTSDPLIVDALHDALTDKLYDELKKRGRIT